MLIKDIKIKNRFRKDFGDLEPLKQSIKNIGLLHPPVVNEDNILIAGERRLKALKELGYKDIKVNQINLKEIIRGEYDENAVRKDFTKTEAVAVWEAMESYQFKRSRRSESEQRDKPIKRASKFLGMSTDTLSRAKQVIDTGDEKLINEMNETGKVNRVYRKIRLEKQKEEIKKLKPIKGEYDVLVIDPPWKYKVEDYEKDSWRGTVNYPTMSLEEIKKLKLPLRKNALIFLWFTNTMIKEAIELTDAWDIERKTILTWDKVNMGVGHFLRNITEHCIICFKGKPYFNNTKWTTLISEKRTTHSTKPEIFYKMVDEICAGRKLDYFARKERKGWDVYGNEVPQEMEVKTKK